jgi:hypothetical protein
MRFDNFLRCSINSAPKKENKMIRTDMMILGIIYLGCLAIKSARMSASELPTVAIIG